MLLCSHKSAVSLAFSISYDSTTLNKVPKIKEPRCNKQDLYFKMERKLSQNTRLCVCVYSEQLVIIFRELQMNQRWVALRVIDWTHTPISLLTATVNPLKMGSNVIERHSGSTHPHTVSRATSSPALIWSTCYSCCPLNSWATRFHTLSFLMCVCLCVCLIYSLQAIMSVYYSLYQIPICRSGISSEPCYIHVNGTYSYQASCCVSSLSQGRWFPANPVELCESVCFFFTFFFSGTESSLHILYLALSVFHDLTPLLSFFPSSPLFLCPFILSPTSDFLCFHQSLLHFLASLSLLKT